MSGDHHHYASPGPAGLVALAMACFTFGAIHTGMVAGSAAPLLGCWLLGGFVVQFTVAVIELRDGHMTGGNVFLFFSAFFMLTTGLELILKTILAKNGMTADSHLDGWAWLTLSIALTLWSPAYLTSVKSMTFLVIAILPACWIITGVDIGYLPKTWSYYDGVFLFITGCFGLYTGAGMILNTAFGKTIIPLGKPFIAPQAH
ncbi:MAG: hypothetical protein CVU90_00810 [Firmicutes bacterium HGW-Firmicutes-15]|nr:MAG: hypothetical protein CVU90_00810 [Firmicutes bacterium HGW-Firmicutes-15]